MPSDFKRSPSKVWWGNEMEYHEVSTSPGSQDSGFSDTETSPNQDNTKKTTPKKETPSQRIPKDIFKELSSQNVKENFNCNYKEKSTPEKDNLVKRLVQTEVKAIPEDKESDLTKSEPVRKSRYTKNSPKVSRNLFTSSTRLKSNQYSDNVQDASTFLNTSEEATVDDSYAYQTHQTDSFEYTTKSLPTFSTSRDFSLGENSKSAPAVLETVRVAEDVEGVTNFNNSLSSDCDSELECLFHGKLESPKHTSTPKTDTAVVMRLKKEKLPLSLFLKYQQDRVPPILTDLENKALEMWMKEARQGYDPECMTTLQCKSIVGELNQKVAHLAACSTTIIRGVISHGRCIEMEFNNFNNSDSKNINPIGQSLTGNITEFIKTHTRDIHPNILKIIDQIRCAKTEDSLKLISILFNHWQDIRQEVLFKEIKKLVNKLEYPTSEIDLRATITGITSIALRNEEIVELFTKADIVPILLILCEKCEGSSIRSLLLRALATISSSSSAVRQFEKFSGVQIIADTLEEYSRPEPERSEAVALLAQVTAPWLEDNHSVKGLQEYSRKLVRSLTKFAATTRCCQNLLLCTAALANLSTMDSKSVKYMINSKTAKVLMESVESRGPRASIYLLEQVSTLLANISALDTARKQLTEVRAPAALLCFLKINRGLDSNGQDVEKRLQQKSIIALSRLCGEKEAAMQVVELGGVEKLVKMCREKEERFDSDAVLVAALATLRKIVDSCGSDVLSAQDAQELVQPKLLDSFLAYSSQNESYV